MKPRRKKREAHTHAVGWFAVCLLALVVFTGWAAYQGVIAQIDMWLVNLPSVEHVDEYSESRRTTVYAADGTTRLAEFYLEDRQPVSLDAISPFVSQATVATEDSRFYQHEGVDLRGIVRAVVNNLRGGELEGASTISQQLVRNTVLADEAKTISLERKVREAQLAVDLEKTFDKDQILTMYLNTVNYGDNCYGIQAAAEHYFSKSAAELTLNEAATLVGIPQSPTNLTPTIYPESCLDRRNTVLGRMLSTGYITQETYDECAAQPLGLAVAPDPPEDGIEAYPYFTSYVRDLLLEEYSASEVFKGGLTVYTTLDVNLQNKAEEAAQAQYDSMSSEKEVSMTCIDPSTGYIVAMIGGRDYYADQFNLATQAQRQAGSSFKTFTLCAAIEQGINPSTNIDCSDPATINGWTLHNIDNANFGTRSIQSAFAVSSNTGFARLQQIVGNQSVKEMAQRLGVTSELEAVDSLTLGTQGVNTLDMAGAYATIAAQGVHRDSCAITKIINADGATIFEHQDNPTQVLSKDVAYAATKVMTTVFTSGTATAARLSSGQPAAGKTGTSEEYRDEWLCAFTPQYSCSVWIGTRQEQPYGSANCSYYWRTFMTMALEDRAVEQFPTGVDPKYNKGLTTNAMAQSSTTQQSGSTSGSTPSASTSSQTTTEPEYAEQTVETTTVPADQLPQTSGQTLDQAAESLTGYEAEYVQEPNSTVPAGQVIYQEVVNGVVRLHVSSGPNA